MKVAIANRGEVAVRIIQACKELGHQTLLMHSEADMKTLAYRMSDEQVCIGPAPSTQSYLSIENNIQGAKSYGADAVHPGFGFLSENANFAQSCEDNGLIFIGPTSDAIKLFGDKIAAKKLVESIGDFTVPGYSGAAQDVSTLKKECEKIGYPVIIKVTGGGGGRGLKIVRNEGDFDQELDSAQREGLSSFGSSNVFIEKYLDHAKHIEVQIFADASGKVYHLHERECSVQRRHQKIIEESPALVIDDSIKQQIIATAIKIIEQSGYRGAGTVEFLLQDDQFYFLEVNTRLQVEHTVTEMTTQLDLVKAQLLCAEGKSLMWLQQDIQPKGHAIECRIYAEDPYNKALPSIGEISFCRFPMGMGRRFDTGIETGDEVTPYYDSMVAKIIVWDETRSRAIEKMKCTLKETIIFGVKTNIPFLIEILQNIEFVEGIMTTQFIEKFYPQGLETENSEALDENEIDDLVSKVGIENSATGKRTQSQQSKSPWYNVQGRV